MDGFDVDPEYDESDELVDEEYIEEGPSLGEWLGNVLRALALGCGFILIVGAVCVSYVVEQIIGPQLDADWEALKTKLVPALEETVKYFKKGDYPYLPGDVILSELLEEIAPENGFTEYDIQAMVAGAARFDIRPEDIVGIQMNASWPGGYADMFILSLAIAEFLDDHRYHWDIVTCPTPMPVQPDQPPPTPSDVLCVPINPRHEAIKDLYLEANPGDTAGAESFLARVLATSERWAGPLDTVEIKPIVPEENFDWQVIFMEMLRYRLIGYIDELVFVNGMPVISGGGAPPGPYPDVPDGFFICPYGACIITGYDFGDPVYNKDGELIRDHHPGVDLGKAGESAVVAACNGRVTYAAWMNSDSLWISGVTVWIECNPSSTDPTPICTGYGHGLPDTLKVEVGDSVDAGDWLFTADNTGFSFGTHLHFDIRAGGGGPYCNYSIDPKAYGIGG
jgi:hypothetical protein